MTIGRDRRPVLIAALSGRALAAAAHRAGERPIVLDCFGDEDTHRYALTCMRLPGRAGGVARGPFFAALRRLGGRVRGLVYGAGFERDPSLLADAAGLLPILGNPPDAVVAVKDPFRFASLLARLGLPHPAIRSTAPARPGWLRKAVGGSGGAHVAWAAPGRPPCGTYVQKAVPGRSVSATFVADGRRARILAFTEQWTSGDATAPFRFGGCTGPVTLPARLARRIGAACQEIVEATRLVGLNSLDMLVDGTEFHILEVNPRPGASLDVLDGLAGQSLWRLHHDALAGRLPKRRRASRFARAMEIVYAPRRWMIPRRFIWPAWSADRGQPGSSVQCREPICTVLGTSATAAQARECVRARSVEFLTHLTVRRLSPTTGVPHAEEAALA